MNDNISGKLLGINAMAKELGVTTRRLREWALDLKLPYEHSDDGRQLYFDREVVWRRVYEMSGRGPKGNSCVTLHNASETAKKLGIAKERLDQMTRNGDLPCFYCGGRFLYALDVVMATEFAKALEKSKRASSKDWRREVCLAVPDDDGEIAPANPDGRDDEAHAE